MLVHPAALYESRLPKSGRALGPAAAILALAAVVGCSTSRPVSTSGPQASTGGLETTQAFVAALNAGDAREASEFVDWDLWVAEDPRLASLVHDLKQDYANFPPTPDDRVKRPIEHSSVTLGELLDASDPGPLLARSAKERFIVEADRDFAPGVRAADARVIDYHSDQRERSATLLMPNGEVLETILVWTDGKYRLVPRW